MIAGLSAVSHVGRPKGSTTVIRDRSMDCSTIAVCDRSIECSTIAVCVRSIECSTIADCDRSIECSTIADVGRPTVGDRRAEVCGGTELPFSSCAVRESRLRSLDAESSGDVVADLVGVPRECQSDPKVTRCRDSFKLQPFF